MTHQSNVLQVKSVTDFVRQDDVVEFRVGKRYFHSNGPVCYKCTGCKKPLEDTVGTVIYLIDYESNSSSFWAVCGDTCRDKMIGQMELKGLAHSHRDALKDSIIGATKAL